MALPKRCRIIFTHVSVKNLSLHSFYNPTCANIPEGCGHMVSAYVCGFYTCVCKARVSARFLNNKMTFKLKSFLS